MHLMLNGFLEEEEEVDRVSIHVGHFLPSWYDVTLGIMLPHTPPSLSVTVIVGHSQGHEFYGKRQNKCF